MQQKFFHKSSLSFFYGNNFSSPGRFSLKRPGDEVEFDPVHNIKYRVKFRRICVESLEQNGTSITQTILLAPRR